MLSFVNLLGAVLFVLTCLVVGVRLLWLSRRTGELPELLMGLAFAVAGFVGYLLDFLPQLVDLPAAFESLRPYLSRGLVSIGSVLVAVATWKIFYARGARARAFVVILAILLLFEVFPPAFSSADGAFLFRRFTLLLLMLPYAWLSVSSFRLRASLERQWAIGVGDEDRELARRLRLWGLGTASIAGLFLTIQVVESVHHFSEVRLPEELLVSIWGIACAVFMWQAFFGRAPQRVAGAEGVEA